MPKKLPNQALRRLHAQGQQVLRATKTRKSRNQASRGTLDDLRAETRAEKYRLMEARHFARLYNGKQLDWLCQLGQKKG